MTQLMELEIVKGDANYRLIQTLTLFLKVSNIQKLELITRLQMSQSKIMKKKNNSSRFILPL